LAERRPGALDDKAQGIVRGAMNLVAAQLAAKKQLRRNKTVKA